VLGTEFSYKLLRAVHSIPESNLQQMLRTLTDAELLYEQGVAPEASYQFKHALIRDAAYEALLKSRRKELHRTVACALDEGFPVIKEAHPEVLARHWTEAEELESAITAWQQAGTRAAGRHAYREADEHYHVALTLVSTLPESRETEHSRTHATIICRARADRS